MHGDRQESEFLNHLRDEKLQTMDARTKFTVNKLLYATALLGLGSLELEFQNLKFNWLLYLVPFVALAFDFYVMAEDYSIKRLGAFLKVQSSDPLETKWEKWVSRNRDPFAPMAMPVLTLLLLAGAGLLIAYIDWNAQQSFNVVRSPGYWTWATGVTILIGVSYWRYRRLRRHAEDNASVVRADAPQFPKPLRALVTSVQAADHLLTKATFSRACRLFTVSVTVTRSPAPS